MRKATRARKFANWTRKNVPFVNGLYNVMQGRRFGEPMMHNNSYDLNQVCGLLQEKGCHNVCLRFTDTDRLCGVFFVFEKKEAPVEGK
jgi:hypothetical protein